MKKNSKQRSAAPRVVVVGSSNTDLVVACDELPKPGQTQLAGKFSQSHGGKGANQAVAAARAGGHVVFCGRRGADDFGVAAHKALLAEKIDVRAFRIDARHPSGVALILLGGKSRENLIAVAASANDAVAPADIAKLASEMKHAGAALAQLEVPMPAVLATARLAKRCGVPFIFNPAPAPKKLPPELLRLIHTIVPNEHEAYILTGKRDPHQAARALQALGCRNVVVTLGAKGAYVLTPAEQFQVRAPKTKVVDTVGAGDCFCGWLAVGIAEGLPPHAAVARAIRAASLSVTRPGARGGMPYRKNL